MVVWVEIWVVHGDEENCVIKNTEFMKLCTVISTMKSSPTVRYTQRYETFRTSE
jgi:hypothetical protein